MTRASGYARNADDWYCEPQWIVEALLNAEAPFVGVVWDPSCGSGNIPRRLESRGYAVHASDIANRGYGTTGVDFFFGNHPKVASIVTNPPYGVIENYVRHALALTTDRVCILARLALLEGQKRQAFFAETPLARVWVSRRRVSMPPGGTDVPAKGGSIAYAWFVWDHHAHTGAPVLGWV